MADNESPRFKIPSPKENAESWYDKFSDMLSNIDARMFDNLEHLNLIHVERPDVEIDNPSPGVYRFVPHARAVFLSRTHHVEVEVSARFIVLEPGAIIGAVIQSGAVGPQSVEWELWADRMDIDANLVPLGYVHDDYTITWFNAAHLEIGVVTPLFIDSSVITGDSRVKVSSADTTEDFLNPKIAAGAGIGLSILNPGANEQLQITSTGGVAPTGAGRIYIDPVSGNDITGDGTIANPYQTLPVAVTCPRCAPPVSAADFMQGIEFICGPGHYGPGFPAAPTVVTLPRRRKITFTGTDVRMNHILEWGLIEADWVAWAVNPTLFPAMLLIDGNVGAGRPSRADGPPNDTYKNPSFFVLGVYAIKLDTGGTKIPHVLQTRNIVAWMVGNAASGAIGAGDETSTMVWRSSYCTLGRMAVSPGCMVGGEREPLLPAEANTIQLYADNTLFYEGIYANMDIRAARDCMFGGMDRNFQFNPVGLPTPVTDGVITFNKGITFYDCEFGNALYDIGWDGVTGPAASAPKFDEVSYRSWLDMEAMTPAVLNNLSSPSMIVYGQKSRFQGRYSATAGIVDLAPILIGAPFQIPMDNQDYADAPDFVNVPPSPLILFPRGGQFLFSFSVTWLNQQLFISNSIGAALRIIPSGGGPTLIPQTKKFSASDFFGMRATCVMPGYEIQIQDGDAVDLVTWRDCPITGFGPLVLEAEDTWLRIERLS